MNWIKANKFLTGFLAVMLVGIGALGYLLYSASGAYDAASENYNSKATEFNRLRHLPLYPDQENLKKLEAQKTEAADMVSAFQAQLATRQFPTKSMTPAEFQDLLKASVTDIVAKASASNVALPKDNKFYLGFDPYESQPPVADAVPVLVRQLSAIKWVVEKLIENKVTTLVSLTRTPLPEEKMSPSPRGNQQPGSGERNARELVIKNPLDIQLISRSDRFGHFLDTVVGASAPQFYIPRIVRVKNSNPKGPDRAAAAAPPVAAPPITAPAPPGVPPSPGTPPAPEPTPAAASSIPTGYIVGEEVIKADLRLEIVEFVPPKPKANKGAK